MAGARVAAVAALVGDPGRATMLAAMLDGRAHTAGELAAAADVTAATASGHLGKLLDRRLVVVTASGRHRYYSLASNEVAQMLEGIMVVAEAPRMSARLLPRVRIELREARTCYDHIAGRLGVALADRLIRETGDPATSVRLDVSAGAHALLTDLDIDPAEVERRGRRPLCRPCLDWSERRCHLAGALGAELLEKMLALRWLRRARHSRELRVTTVGVSRLYHHVGYRRS